jgi:hippurate hydrolase
VEGDLAVINRIMEFEADMRAWRRHLHAIPELGFDLPRTAAFVAGRLREIGVDAIHEGIATTGIVALVRGRGDGPVVGLRADMDALPIEEAGNVPWRSRHPGRMHACGHDGHTAMLLGAARYLAETRNFAGTAALIFQPSEEESAGAQVMCEQGLMARFGIARVFGLHNAPDLALGRIATRPGPLMAAADQFAITVRGRGGHAAFPHACVDPVAAAVQVAQGLLAIPARRVDPVVPAVVSLTMLRAGESTNIIPETATLAGTVRTLDEPVRQAIAADIARLAEAAAAAHGARAEVAYDFGYPVTVNDAAEAAFAADVAADIVGEQRLERDCPPVMGAEDFAYMLRERPGAYVFLGTGPGAGLHNPGFDYNDDASPIGASWFARLVEAALPLAR